MFRKPFGAVEVGTTVHLAVQVLDADPAQTTATLRTWIDGVGEAKLPMAADPSHRGEGALFAIDLPCEEANLVWYSFIVESGGETAWLGAPEGRVGGEGARYDHPEPPSFQLTVYTPRAIRPSWYEDGMVYQIFPDRYRRDADWHERAAEAISHRHKGIEWRLVEDWDEPPVYDRNPDMSIRTWDFYGGSLKGIQDDLPRLADMGVTAIYLNPIFEAASNHRYDTSDYMRIDPVLGTEEDFSALCAAADALGISIILDGVFNHTGDDSIYFNRYGNYPGVGAWQSSDSPWRDAYHFHEDGSYDCWWGIGNMPALNEGSERVRDLILGPDGVVRHWLRAGARGWRLDVADELTDGFLAEIRRAALAEKPDALVLGEVWEDASNKISYGKLRRYLLGDELDSAMDYPFRDMVIGFLMGGKDAARAAEDVESMVENYPREALTCALNLLSSHDKPRITSVLGGAPDESALPEAERGKLRLTPDQMGLAKARFWLATLLQMTFPGVPSIYYGDEFALEGLSDPGNRRTLPLMSDIRDRDMLTMINNAHSLRTALPEIFVKGNVRAFAPDGGAGDVLAIRRSSTDGQAATVLVNRSRSDARTVRVPVDGEMAIDLVSGADLPVGDDGRAEVSLWPLGSAVVYAHPAQRLQKPLRPGAGVIAHVTSIPNGERPGTLGAPARRFIDHLADMGMRYWQVLPVNPTDAYRSPYAGPSAFAGNADLLEEGSEELEAAYASFRAADGFRTGAFFAFARDNEQWLDPYCAFMAVKDFFDGAGRHEWPAELQRYDVAILSDPRFMDRARYHAFLQFRFHVEWREMLDAAHERGIQVIGDIPMYVSDDSADAWSEPEMFRLDGEGRPAQIAGTPPDRFAAEGQIWGNPTYDWGRMRADGYVWWLARLRRSLALYDVVRLDHFLGFQNYFGIPAGGTGKDGAWHAGPGIELFQRAHEAFGPLPFIAEDLGSLTPAVRTLVASCGFPGMDVVEFSDYDVRQGIHPHAEKMLYVSTHDTSTLRGFCARDFCGGDEAAAEDVAEDVLFHCLKSRANVVMMQLQDVLGLGDGARMNKPGVAGGENWTWQAGEDEVAFAVEPMRDLLVDTGRAAGAVDTGEADPGGMFGSSQANRHDRRKR